MRTSVHPPMFLGDFGTARPLRYKGTNLQAGSEQTRTVYNKKRAPAVSAAVVRVHVRKGAEPNPNLPGSHLARASGGWSEYRCDSWRLINEAEVIMCPSDPSSAGAPVSYGNTHLLCRTWGGEAVQSHTNKHTHTHTHTHRLTLAFPL